MAHVSPNVKDLEAESFVGRLLLRERFASKSSVVFDLAGGLMTVPKWIPGARMITSYRISWLRSDLVAGICSAHCWYRKAWPTPNLPVCRRSQASTPRSCA